MSKAILKSNILNILDNQGKSYIKMYDFRGNLIWEQGGGGEWVLQESDYIIGTDGKYYQKWLDINKAVDHNPVPDLNNQWVVDTVSGSLNIDSNFDYYMSNSNYHVANSYSQFKVQWSGVTSMTFLYRSYGESGYDYLVINGLDKPAFTSLPSSSTSGILIHTNGKPTTTYNTLTVECDEGEHFIWFAYRKDSSGDTYSDRAFVGIPNNLISVPEDAVKKGSELRYEYIKSSEVEITRPGYGRFKYYKHYYTPDESKDLITKDYYLGEEEQLTPITRNYLRLDATDGDLHIGVNDLSLFTNLECAVDFEETWTTFTNDGIDVPNGSSLYLRSDGTSTTDKERTFTTSVPCECHGNVMSLLNKNTFETLKTCGASYCFKGLFKGSKIKTAPELPATKLGYYNPSSNATYNMKWHGYESMFYGCTSLVNAPELPATDLSYNCYSKMFYNCTSLVNAPELPATNLTPYCYDCMFYGCTSLVNAPELPATNLNMYCYNSMFNGCTSLVNAPELPANNVPLYAYSYMFKDCTSLKSVELPATEIDKSSAYYQMLYNCSNLEVLKCYVIYDNTSKNVITDSIGYNWLWGVSSSKCTFYKNPDWAGPTTRSISTIPNGIQIVDWEDRQLTPITRDYLRFDATDGDLIIKFYLSTNNQERLIQYTLECAVDYEENWGNLANGVFVKNGHSVYIRDISSNGQFSTDYNTKRFTTSTICECHGNVMSLINKDTFETLKVLNTSMQQLFSSSNIKTAPELPATTLTRSDCYRNMFSSCTSLVNAPELPATTLATGCYANMFYYCTSLVNAPTILPATTVLSSCCLGMFQGCTSLVNAPELPATTLGDQCYQAMFWDCTSLVNAQTILPATNTRYKCYTNMFAYCTSLVNAPVIVATPSSTDCFYGMFYGCTSLNSVTTYVKKWNDSYTNTWLKNVASEGIVYAPNGAEGIPLDSVNGVPSGWTLVNDYPPAA